MVDDSGKHLVITVLERSKIIRFVDIFAGSFWTMARAEDGRIFACGLNNFGQLGFPLPKNEETMDGLLSLSTTLNILAAAAAPEYREPRLTCTPKFPADHKWTHIEGEKHVIARADDGRSFKRIFLIVQARSMESETTRITLSESERIKAIRIMSIGAIWIFKRFTCPMELRQPALQQRLVLLSHGQKMVG